MGLLPNIFPAHPEAPEWVTYTNTLEAGPVVRFFKKIKKMRQQRKSLRDLRAVSDHTLSDLGLHRSGLRNAAADRMTLQNGYL